MHIVEHGYKIDSPLEQLVTKLDLMKNVNSLLKRRVLLKVPSEIKD